jgi:hypothetical protein
MNALGGGIMSMITEFVCHFPIISIISLMLLTIAICFLSQFVLPAMHIRKDLQATIERLMRIKAASKGKISDL